MVSTDRVEIVVPDATLHKEPSVQTHIQHATRKQPHPGTVDGCKEGGTCLQLALQEPTLRFLREKLGRSTGSVMVVGMEGGGLGMEYAVGAPTLATVIALREDLGEGVGGMAKLVVAMTLGLEGPGVCRKMALLSFTS